VRQARGSVSGEQVIRWDRVAGAHGYRVMRNGALLGFTVQTSYVVPRMLPGRAYAYSVVAVTVRGRVSPPSRSLVINTPVPSALWLSDVEPDQTSQQFGELGRDMNVMYGPLAINGKRYKRGLGTHAPGETVYEIGGHFSRFTATVGLDDSHQGGTVEFRVYGDTTCLFDSGVMRSGDPARKVAVSVRGVGRLRLVVGDAGDGSHNDHANWAEAKLVS
jgi:hypothetical protein